MAQSNESASTPSIPPALFALALHDLSIDAVHSKILELQNSIVHLLSSNAQMAPFAGEGDDVCRDAISENAGVIARIEERVQLCRAEVERRRLVWSSHGSQTPNGLETCRVGSEPSQTSSEFLENRHVAEEVARQPAPNGRLTDEELRRRLEAQMQNEEDEGVHL